MHYSSLVYLIQTKYTASQILKGIFHFTIMMICIVICDTTKRVNRKKNIFSHYILFSRKHFSNNFAYIVNRDDVNVQHKDHGTYILTALNCLHNANINFTNIYSHANACVIISIAQKQQYQYELYISPFYFPRVIIVLIIAMLLQQLVNHGQVRDNRTVVLFSRCKSEFEFLNCH